MPFNLLVLKVEPEQFGLADHTFLKQVGLCATAAKRLPSFQIFLLVPI